MAECDICGQYFPNPFELGPHKKSCWNQQAAVLSDFTQSDSDVLSGEETIITEPTAQTHAGVPLVIPRVSQRTESLLRLATRQIDSTCNVRDIHVPQRQQLQPDMVYDYKPVIKCLLCNMFFHTYVCARADAKNVASVRASCVPVVRSGVLTRFQISPGAVHDMHG